jgi:hypothetical protein
VKSVRWSISYFLAAFCCASLLGSIAPMAWDPITNEPRVVRPVTDSVKTVTVRDGMDWYASFLKSSGIRFPAGTYTLEAEDDDYWYFRSPSPLEFRTFDHGNPTADHTNTGGLMLGKRVVRLVPAGGYIYGDSTNKILVWKLGGDFLKMEGKEWRKSY